MQAFATAEDLGKLLKRTFAGDEVEWITALLEAASAYLREDVIGSQVYPVAQSTFTAWPDAGRVDIPAGPLVSIDSVTRDNVAVEYQRVDNYIRVSCNDPVQIKFTYGYPEAPESLKRWACVLVSQTLVPLELKLGLTAGGLSSVAIDDFKAAFADAGEATGMNLSDRNIENLRQMFGRTGVYVVGMS